MAGISEEDGSAMVPTREDPLFHSRVGDPIRWGLSHEIAKVPASVAQWVPDVTKTFQKGLSMVTDLLGHVLPMALRVGDSGPVLVVFLAKVLWKLTKEAPGDAMVRQWHQPYLLQDNRAPSKGDNNVASHSVSCCLQDLIVYHIPSFGIKSTKKNQNKIAHLPNADCFVLGGPGTLKSGH